MRLPRACCPSNPTLTDLQNDLQTPMRIHTALLLATLTLSACSRSTVPTPPTAATPVRVAVAVDGPAAPAIRTHGLLANKDEFRLAFKMGGIVRRISVREGERVRRGERLAELEQAEVAAQVEQARQAQEKAQRDVERGERLYADKVISLEQLQDLRTQSRLTQAALSSAEFNSSHAAIFAPRDGTVLRRLVEEREVVAAGTPVVVVGAEDRGFVVRAGLADRDIVQVKLNDRVQVRLDALPEQVLEGAVSEIASAAEPQSGMFPIEVTLRPMALPLKSGLVAKLDMTPASAVSGSRVHVPIAAIVAGTGRRASVFVLENQQARRREVTVAFIEGESVALSSGVAVGERVITDGALYLEDGEPVAVEMLNGGRADALLSNEQIPQR
jgi:membrane fusion protein, multidrug efflux system